MSPFPTQEDRADAKTTAMFDAEPSTERQCGHCAKDMSLADVEAESSPQDGMCQSCRAFVNECKKESAVADFLDRQPSPIQDIFEKLIAELDDKMKFDHRAPADINETCKSLVYVSGTIRLTLERFQTGDNNNIRIERLCDFYKSIPEWIIDFSIATPLPVILAAIKAAKKAAAAPDKAKALAFAATVRTLKTPEATTAEGKAVMAEITAKIEGFAVWITKQAESL